MRNRARDLAVACIVSCGCVYEQPDFDALELPVVLHFPDDASRDAYEDLFAENLERVSERLAPLSFVLLESRISDYPPSYEWHSTPVDTYESGAAIAIYLVRSIRWGRRRYSGLSLDIPGFCDRGILIAGERWDGLRPGVLLHEIGHTLALQHSDDPGNFMWSGPGEVTEVVDAEQLERMLWKAWALAQCWSD